MKSLISLAGVLLIIFGIATLAYQGFTYTKRENVAQIGDVKITADTQKTVYFPPLLGGLSLVAGVILVVATRRGGE
jgi:hypothetical protein